LEMIFNGFTTKNLATSTYVRDLTKCESIRNNYFNKDR
jgi:hypothetical protein